MIDPVDMQNMPRQSITEKDLSSSGEQILDIKALL